MPARRRAAGSRRQTARPSKEDTKYLFDLGPTHLEVEFPEPRHTIMDVQEPFVRDKEIDKDLYYPSDVNRELVRVFPKGFKIEIPKMVREKLGEKIRARFGR